MYQSLFISLFFNLPAPCYNCFFPYHILHSQRVDRKSRLLSEPTFAISSLNIQKTWFNGAVRRTSGDMFEMSANSLPDNKTYATRTVVHGGNIMATLNVKTVVELQKFAVCFLHHLADDDNQITRSKIDSSYEARNYGVHLDAESVDSSDGGTDEDVSQLLYNILDVKINPISASFTSHDARGRRGNVIQITLWSCH